MKEKTVNSKGAVEKHYPGSYYDAAGLETWLTQMAKQGMRLEQQCEPAKSLLFRQGEPAHVRFLLIPDIKKKDKRTYEELRDQYAHLGWNFICRVQGQVMIYETEDLWAVKPSWPLTEEDYDRKWRSLCRNIFWWVILAFLVVGFVAAQLFEESVTYYDRITVWPWVFALGTLLPALMAFLDILEIYDIYAWWKHYRRQEEVKQWRAIPALRWTKFFGSWVMIAVTFVVPVMEAVHEDVRGDYHRLETITDEAPLVTLELVDEEYTPHNGGVTKKDSLLIPEEIEVYSYRETGEEWHNMEFHYYHLRSENMARRLAEDEAQRTGWQNDPAAPMESTGGFDALWLYEEEDWQYLTACTGDVAITISNNTGDLMDCLPEIYDIVTDYRANN